MFPRKPIQQLIDDSMFMPIEQFNSKEVREKIADQEQHKKTVREILTRALQEKIKRK